MFTKHHIIKSTIEEERGGGGGGEKWLKLFKLWVLLIKIFKSGYRLNGDDQIKRRAIFTLELMVMKVK